MMILMIDKNKILYGEIYIEYLYYIILYYFFFAFQKIILNTCILYKLCKKRSCVGAINLALEMVKHLYQ